ncbi:glycosyltransferase [Porcincola intestinalis]|uniref:glycosyltransferase n=1 Tax=Porcincola intestinalis TaxID=2606632 RepID=UPI0023F09BD6|nr:glycosyltransferase family 2 protein [Porcincola intestinalis]MCI6767842.1 glycosyltransferase [Lachnospiraceae bacterium]MDD7060216.1 glycosyltransferase family 2 protein [Porcincola intestinalis]MDY5284284.1 glycosyltransferase family 2 protein [Porcincola intestinalis]
MADQKIACGIVLYNPDFRRLKLTIASVCDQVSGLIFVDNGSGQDCACQIRELLTERYGKNTDDILIENHENRGIAAALNQIMTQAKRMGYSHVLTLDDDSRCDAELVRVLKHCLRYPKAGMICPDAVQEDESHDQEEEANADDNATGFGTCCERSPMNGMSHHVSLAEDCITAGSLVSVAAWRESGGFDEKMFIDFVDMDFCATLREHGYRIYHVSNIAVHQRYGNVSKSFRIFGKKFYRFNYPPVRIYYSVRNQIYFIRKHRGRHSIRISSRLLFLFGYIGKHLVFENNRVACAKAILQGCKEGIVMSTDS